MALLITYKDELRDILEGLGLTEAELAGALGTTPRTLRRWLAGANPNPDARGRIEDLDQLLRRLKGSIKADAIPKWTRRKVEMLGGRRPAELFRSGQLEPVFEVAEAMASGAFV